MHLVRNTLGLGIELPETRTAKGKSTFGTLRLNACHESGGIAIEYINLCGGILPFVRLREQVEAAEPGGKRENIVIVQYARQKIGKIGLVINELRCKFQTVIKPLGSIFKHINGIGGSTILGSGDVALILDMQSPMALTSVQHNQ